MKAFEIKVRIPDSRTTEFLDLTKSDILVLLVKSKETPTIEALADRCGCRRESLSRLLNGRAGNPILKKRLAKVLEELLNEVLRSDTSGIIRVA